jgi:hypothetical protein
MATTRRPAAKTAAKRPAAKRATTRKTAALSVVPDKPADQGETSAEAPKRKTIAEAAASGSQRDLLEATRDRIARTLDDPKCPPRDLASLTKRLTDIADQIAALDLRAKEEGADSEQIPDDDTYGAASI